MGEQIQIDVRDPSCPMCGELLEKTGEYEQEGYILLELACRECKKRFKESPVKNFEAVDM